MFNQAKADEICNLLAEGESLRRACEIEGVNPSTVLGWCKANTEFAEQYARSREIGYLRLADELLEISDDSKGDSWVDDQGNVRTDAERVARSRLRVDTRKWMLSKMLPKVYGEKVVHQGDEDNPIQHSIRVTFD